MNTIDKKYHSDMESQISYAARKYGGNLPPSVAKAHAQMLAIEAMKKYDSKKGNVKTYLNRRLQKLSRIAYKATTPLNIPESRLMSRAKIRDFKDEYKDTYGSHPTASEIAKATKVSMTDAKNFMLESASVSNESSFDNIHGSSAQSISGVNIVNSLPEDLKVMGKDIYIGGLNEKAVLKKHKIGRTTYFSKKRKIDTFLKDNSGLSSIQYN